MSFDYPYRKFPKIYIEGFPNEAVSGQDSVRQQIAKLCEGRQKTILVIECYPGVNQQELLEMLTPLKMCEIIHSDDLALTPTQIDSQIDRDLTDDPVFGIMTTRRLEEFFPKENLECVDSRRYCALLRCKYYGSGNQCYAIYLYFQALGLGTAGSGWKAASDSFDSRGSEYSMEKRY